MRAGLDAEANAAQAATAGPWRNHDTHLDHGGHTATVLTDRDDLNATELIAWLPSMSHEPWDERRNVWHTADHIARQDPHATLARAARTRLHVDRLLAEKHHVSTDQYYTCPAATQERDGGSYAETGGGGTCTCGRDERVRGYLQLLLPEES